MFYLWNTIGYLKLILTFLIPLSLRQSPHTSNAKTTVSPRRYMYIKMTLYKILSLILLSFTLFACNQASKQPNDLKVIDKPRLDTSRNDVKNSAASTNTGDSSSSFESIEDKMMDTIFNLKEVQERAKYIEGQTNGKRHLKVWLADTPNLPTTHYYWIKVGEDNGTNLVTHFNFYVYLDSMRIMYYDIPNDSALTLDEWRKTKNGT